MIFRGIDAAASLKRLINEHKYRNGDEIFRGIDAAASLKLGLQASKTTLKFFVIFRGIDAAASLKRDSRRCVCCYIWYLPRHRCRGLIEAAAISVPT